MEVFDLGILGGGQLGRMTAMAATSMGVRSLTLDPDPRCPASFVSKIQAGRLDDPSAIEQIFRRCQSVVLENEFIRQSVLDEALRRSGRPPETLFPRPSTLGTIQDKLLQRRRLEEHGIAGPKAVKAADAASLGFPCVLKARFGGYDGNGTIFVENAAGLDAVLAKISPDEWLAEERVPFDREVAVMAFRHADGATGSFPVVETVQKNGVCDEAFLPTYAPSSNAGEVARRCIEAFDGIGLFGVEMFEVAGEVLVNEIAPRAHNSGHYTLDWGGTTQFEALVRLAIGADVRFRPDGNRTVMINLFGTEKQGDLAAARKTLFNQMPKAKLHWYEKLESRPGRKMGHINIVADPWDFLLPIDEEEDVDSLRGDAHLARELFLSGWNSE